MSKYPPPKIEFICEKDPSGAEGSWMVGIIMTDIPNKKLANMSLGWMKEAMNDQIIKLMGKIAMQGMDEKRKEKA